MLGLPGLPPIISNDDDECGVATPTRWSRRTKLQGTHCKTEEMPGDDIPM